MIDNNELKLILSALTISGGTYNKAGMKMQFDELKKAGKINGCENESEIIDIIYDLHQLQICLVSYLVGNKDNVRKPADVLAAVQLDTTPIMDILNISDDELVDAIKYITERNDRKNDI